MSLLNHSMKELEDKLHKKEITSKELVEASLERIKEVDKHVQAFITLDEDKAKQMEEDMSSDDHGKLFGLPVGIKDNIVTKDVRTTAGSQLLKNFDEPLYDATVVEKLKQEKATIIGKLNLDEFGMGSSTENSSYGKTRNPWHTDYVPGGSSGGSAAAVAAGEVSFSLGSDTGGRSEERRVGKGCGGGWAGEG